MDALPPALACLLVALALAAAPPAQASDPPFVIPCGDARGCPDLLVDDVQLLAGAQTVEPFSASDCAVQEGSTQAGLRQLMRFTYTSPNLGLGDLIVGSPAEHPEWFEWHPCHQHYHFKAYADYRLWTPEAYLAWDAIRSADPSLSAQDALAAHPELLSGLITGEKKGFCVIDIAPALPSARHAPVIPDPLPKHDDCGATQGISVGWADTYDLTLDGQWIDVTDVAPGPYVLEAEVNAEHVYQELDYANNRGAVPTAVAPGPSNVAGGGGPVEDALAGAAGLVPDVSASAEAHAQVAGQEAGLAVDAFANRDRRTVALDTPLFGVGVGPV
jgi:hypothetical protein